MKSIMKVAVLSVALCGACLVSKAQTSPLPSPPIDLQGSISNALANVNTNGTFFTKGEVELRLGAVYSQKTGEAGTLVAVEKWDIFGVEGLGIGAEGITSGQDQAAEFAYFAYRKTYGNIAGVMFLGGGYEELDHAPLGVIGGRVEWRPSAHLGTWVSAGYGMETKQQNARGMIVGGGVSYAF